MEIRPARSYPVPGHPDLESTYQYHPGMPENVILRMSKSSVGDYGFCQQQYFIKRVLGVKEPETEAMIRGSNVHDATEDFYNNLTIEDAVALKKHGYERVLKHFRTFIPDSSPKRGVFELGEQEHLDKLFVAEAKRFMVSNPEYFKPVGNEITLNAVVEIDGQKVHLTGIIDRMFMDEDGAIHLHELKTGVFKDKKSKWESMRKEMAFYVYLLTICDHPKLKGVNTSYWGWDHTGGLLDEYDDRVFRVIETIKSPEIALMKKDISDLIKSHQGYDGSYNGDSFLLKPLGAVPYICEPWCRVKAFCPRYGATAIPWEEE